MLSNSLSVTFISTSRSLLNFYITLILRLHKHLGLLKEMHGPIFLPTRCKRFTLLRPVHIYKTSGLHYIFKTYRIRISYNNLAGNTLYCVYLFLLYLKYKMPVSINMFFFYANFIV